MHMSLASALRAHLADKKATWSGDVARWNEEGRARIALVLDGALTADAIVDAHLRGLTEGARVTLAYAGEATPVALRTAARFGIALLDASTLPREPAPAPPVTEEIGTAWTHATEAFALPRIERAPEPSFPLPPAGFFRALERPPIEIPDAADAFAALDTLILAASEPEPELAHADVALPWDLSLSEPEPEPVQVEAAELAAMPWSLHAEQHELLPAGRAARVSQPRPTTMAQDWGLPWPRPVAPTGGMAIADPRLWHAQARIEQVREDLQRAGAPSFGAVKPEGSAWLKRLTEFGGP